MKKKFLVLIIIILSILAAVLIFSQTTSTIKKELRDFSLADTASVTKIFLADMEGNFVLLERDLGSGWTVNKEYKAQTTVVQDLLATMMYTSVRAPVPIPARDGVIKYMSSLGVKVEVYQIKPLFEIGRYKFFEKEKLTKVFYVGDNTQDKLGTYMLMENSALPFICYIPGFTGFLHTRYSTDVYDWRDQTIFNYYMNDIESVTLEYPHTPQNSFRIENIDNRNFRVFSFEKNDYINDLDTVKAINYLTGFYNVRFEQFAAKTSSEFRDSVTASLPYQIMTVKLRNGEENQISTFLKKTEYSKEDLEIIFHDTHESDWDRERLYALVNNEQDFVFIQYFVFGRILKNIDFFRKDYQLPLRSGLEVYEF